MSDSPEGGSQRDLADRIIDFLEYQKEVYGAFAEPPAPSLEAVQPTDSVILNNAGDITPQPSTQSAQNVEKKVSSGSLTQPQTAQPKENVPDNPQPSDIYDQVAACQTLDELYQVCLTADILRTDLENTNLVFGVGNPNADLLIIGEAPGQNEDIQKEPFVGRAGQLLNKILAAINFQRSDIYIANILKHRPPNNRDPQPAERKRSLPFLLKQIELINPKVILCLGRISAQTLLDTKQPMKNMRSKFVRFMDRYDLTVTYHPAALLRNPNWKRGTWEDVQMLRARYDELGGKP